MMVEIGLLANIDCLMSYRSDKNQGPTFTIWGRILVDNPEKYLGASLRVYPSPSWTVDFHKYPCDPEDWPDPETTVS